ncbi:FAD-dependent oxidoreductase [Microbacterium sp. B2969]|uniref:FAD-dependent oxidoreductase n=1 Tax=Microbacterium alkaliflavum TaxID=3248839 RepID=A0ABW7QIU5_9MICO
MASDAHSIVVLGGGPAGMASALALHTAGHDVVILERYREARPAGNILNLWPPPIKALSLMGVDVDDLGAPCHSTFRTAQGHVRADIEIPQAVVDEFGGGFIGMLRPDLYRRMLAALPPGVLQVNQEVTGISDRGDHVELTMKDGTTRRTPLLIGADGIDSMVRAHLWGASPKREHKLHIIGGYTFEDVPGAEHGEAIIAHSRTVQGSYTAIRSDGRTGFQWWTLEACDPDAPAPADLRSHALALARRDFGSPLTGLIEGTTDDHVQRWVIRDRKPLKKWSKGRITLAGDAAHATSPYAAYGAGMSIGDGYFLGQLLAGIDLADTAAVTAALDVYDDKRIPHTTMQVQQAYILGKVFHHAPAPLRPLRDFVMDHTPMLQKQIGERSPHEIVAQLDEMGEGIRANA